MTAQPVIVSTSLPIEDRAAVPVIVDDTAPLVGPARAVVIVGSGPRAAGRPLRVRLAPAGSPIVGPALPVYVVSGALTYAQKIQNLAPLAHWPLADLQGSVALDASGNGRNGAYTSVTLGVSGIGDGQPAARFNGTSSICNVYSASLGSAFNPALLTISAWLKVSAAGIWTDGSNDCAVHFGVDTTTNYVRFLKTSTNNQFQVSYVANSTAKGVTKSSFSPTGWFHVAVTVDAAADQMKVYLNGTQEGATQTSLGAWAGSLANNRCLIGAQTTVPNLPWSGDLAHVAVWARVLSAAEIAGLATGAP